MIADCERGLGRPERALALASSPEAGLLDTPGKVEMLIVAAGARRDMGQPDAAVLTLQVPALRARAGGPWLARLRYAYADALAEVGRRDEARDWFRRAAQVDPEEETDALERIDELDGVIFTDLGEGVAAGEADDGEAGADDGEAPGEAGDGDGPGDDGVAGRGSAGRTGTADRGTEHG